MAVATTWAAEHHKLLESGMDGVRVSVINVDSHAVVGNVIDLTNKTPASGVIHFGKSQQAVL